MTNAIVHNNSVPHGNFGGGGGGSREPVTAPTDLVSRHTAWMLLAVSEGVIESIDQVYLDNKPIQNFSHAVSCSLGDVNAKVIDGFSDTPNTVANPLTLYKYNGGVPANGIAPYTVLNIDPNADYADIEFTLSRLETVNSTNGDRLQNAIAIMLISSNSNIAVIPPLAPPVDGEVVPTGKAGRTTEPYAWSVRIKCPQPKPINWYVHICKTSEDTTNDTFSDCSISSVTSFHKDTGGAYPCTALIAGRVEDASQLGNQVPIISAKGKGIKLMLPSNYNPTTRTRTGNWNGSFSTIGGLPRFQYSNNLSWVIYNILTDWHVAVIDGRTIQKFLGIDRAYIDIWSFEEFAKHCDEVVQGTVRHTVNGQFMERKMSKDFINDLLSLGNARYIEYGGLIKIIYDKELLLADIDLLPVITPDLVEDGLFEYTSSNLSDRFTQVNVIYSDKTEYNHTKTAIATSYELESYLSLPTNYFTDKYDFSSTDVTLIGCDNFAQATRKARWLLWNALQLTEFVSFQTIIPLLSPAQYFVLADGNNTGRFEQVNIGVSKTELVLDTINPIGTKIYFYDELGQATSASILSHVGKTVVIANGSTRPAKASTYSIDANPTVYQVLSISKDEGSLKWTYTGVKYDGRKYNFIDGEVNEGTNTHQIVTPMPVVSNIEWYDGTLTWNGIAGATFLVYLSFANSQSVEVITNNRYHLTIKPLWVTIIQVVGILRSEPVTMTF